MKPPSIKDHPPPNPNVPPWNLEFYEDEHGSKPVRDWIKTDLSPTKRRAIGKAMQRILQVQGPAVQNSHWGRRVAPGIFEFRLRMTGKNVVSAAAIERGVTADVAREQLDLDPSEVVLLRVFFAVRGSQVILLLHGYDKGKQPSKKKQQAEISVASARLARLEQLEAKTKKAEKTGTGQRTP